MSDTQHGSFFVSEVVRYSPHSIVPWEDRIVENWWSLEKQFLRHLPEVGKGSGNPAPKLADRWKSGVWLGKSDLTDEHLVRTDDGVVYARSVRRLAENSWSEENLSLSVHQRQNPRVFQLCALRLKKWEMILLRTGRGKFNNCGE